jgi:hypothetical protein
MFDATFKDNQVLIISTWRERERDQEESTVPILHSFTDHERVLFSATQDRDAPILVTLDTPFQKPIIIIEFRSYTSISHRGCFIGQKVECDEKSSETFFSH